MIEDYLGDGVQVVENINGDFVFISRDGSRKIRFDFNNPKPHRSPHGHIEELINGRWKKSGPVYPKDVPHQ